MRKATVGGFAALLALGMVGCSSEQADASCDTEQYAMGLRFQQQGAEAQALQRQAYNVATRNLDDAIDRQPPGKPLAVISDLDETAINNSELYVSNMEGCEAEYRVAHWADWERDGDPKLIPGAKEFFDHANERGVAIYYLSNRYEENKKDTVETLRGLGLPQADDAHVLLMGPPKEERRAQVARDHTVVLLLGDSMRDFDGGFEGAELSVQRDLVQENATHFGQDWIVLPNPIYGDWSKAELEAKDGS